MPIYEYVCQACQEQIELFQSISDAPATECPKCQKNTLKKMVSAPSFHLKGDGWYVTDFRDKGKKNLNQGQDANTSGSDQGDSGTSASSSESKTSSSDSSTPPSSE